MSRDAAWLPSEVADHLVELKTWVRWQWLLRGAGRVGLVTSLSLGGALFADYCMDLSTFGRGVAATSVAAVTLLALIAWVLAPMCRRMGWSELAALAERAHPEWKGCLTSSVELNDPSHADNFAGSPVMRQMLHQQAGDRVAELDVERVISSRAAWRSVKLGLAACILLAVPIFVAPSTYRQLWQRLLVPWGNWGTAGAWQIDVANGDRVVARGADVELLATAKYSKESETPKSLLLEWRDTAGTTDRRTMPFDEAREAFVAVVPHVMRDFDFRVLIDRQYSRDYRVQVVEPPVVTQVRLDVEPPAYAGWPAQTIDGAVGSIRVFEHSRLRFTLEFNKPVEQAEVVWRSREQKTEFTLDDNQLSATVDFKSDPTITGPFAFSVKDRHDLANNDTVPRELLIITDEPPKLAVKGVQSTDVRPDDVVPIDVTASDDIGVGELELHVEISGRKESELQIDEQVRGQKQVEQRFTLDLAKLNLEQGQWLTYKVRVTDERPEPGPHEVWSEPRVLRVNRKAAPPGANELAKSHDELQNELKDLGREITERRNALENLRKEAELASRNKQEPPSHEQFEELERQLHKLTQRSEKLAEQLAADPIFNELGEKVREVAQQELPAAEKEMQLAKDAQGEEQSQDLRRAEQQLDNATKKLKQLDKPFQQLADLQRDLLELRRLSQQADQLANRADNLAKNDAANADTSKPEVPAKDDPNQPEVPARDDQIQNAAEAAKGEQEKQQLAHDQQKLADALNDLLKKRPELLNAAKRDQLAQLAELSKQARELADEQQELADAMQERQQEAAANTAELAHRQEDLQQRAERAAVDAETRDRTKNVSPVNPEPLRDAVAALQQGNLDEARRQQEKAANELDRLAADLEKAKAAAEAQQADPKAADQPNAVNADSNAQPENTKPSADAVNNANQPNDAKLNEEKPSKESRSDDKPKSEGPVIDKGQGNKPSDNKPLDNKPLDNKPAGESNKEAHEPREATRPASLAEAARQLANEQAELAAKANEAREGQTPQDRQKAAEQLAREQAQLKDRIAELPVQTADKNEAKLRLDSGTQPPNESEKPASDDQNSPKVAQSDQNPKDDAAKGDATKGDASKGDAPKNDTPKGDALKKDAPKADAPKEDAPKSDAPNSERPTNDGQKNDSQTSPNQAPNAPPGEEPEPPQQERKLSGSEAAQQRAVQHAEHAREALAQGNLDRAAQEQRRTEQALHDVAARAEAAEQMQQANAPQGQADQNKTGEEGDPAENNNAPNANALNRELPQPEQVAQLAEEQRQLMQEVARALEQQQGASAKQPSQPQQAQSKQQAAANQAGQQPQANATQDEQNKNQNQEASTAEKKVRDTQTAQNELAQQSQQLAEQVKQELGEDSKEAQDATQAARLCES